MPMKTKVLRFYVDLPAGWTSWENFTPYVTATPMGKVSDGNKRIHFDVELPEVADEGEEAKVVAGPAVEPTAGE